MAPATVTGDNSCEMPLLKSGKAREESDPEVRRPTAAAESTSMLRREAKGVVMKLPRLLFIVSIIVFAVVARLIPHPFNFTPLGAAALFAAATLERKRFAFLIPFAAMLLSDAILRFHSGMPVVYGHFSAIVCIGFALRGRRRSPLALLAGAVSSATLFFIVTNSVADDTAQRSLSMPISSPATRYTLPCFSAVWLLPK